MKKGILILVLGVVFSLLTGFSGYAQDKEGEVYVIKKGDTLWDLSDTYLKDPYQWPELWQRNQYITNPHLIYPGNSLRLYGKPRPVRPEKVQETEAVGTGVGEAVAVLEEAEVEGVAPETAEPAVVGKKEEVPAPVEKEEVPALMEVEEGLGAGEEEFAQILRKGEVEFIILEEDSLGRIIDARYQKRLLAQGDTVYIAMKERPPEVGEKYLIFRTQKMLKNPYTGEKGRKIYILGALQVTAVKGVLYQAEITDSMDAIKRGDEIMTYRIIQ